MLTGITTRTSTPQEDAEPWPGGSARPVLGYLTGTLGMTDADARELLKAARTAQAETGPGALADYPVPGGDAHLLIHYAPGSRAYRFKLTTLERGTARHQPGTGHRAREPPRPGRAVTRPGNAGRQPAGDAGGTPARAASPAGRGGQPGPAGITVTIWHNVALDGAGPAYRHAGRLPARRPVVRVFAYQADPPGGRRRRSPRRRSRSSTTTPGTPPALTWPAPTTGAGCGRCPWRRRGRRRSPAGGRTPAGWNPVRGPLTEVRTGEHGTRPLPLPRPLPGHRAGAWPRKEDHDE